MKFYLIDASPIGKTNDSWHGTLKSAHLEAKDLTPREDVRIREVEVQTDKEGILYLLANGGPISPPDGRIWGLTKRGGLVEFDPETDTPLKKGI